MVSFLILAFSAMFPLIVASQMHHEQSDVIWLGPLLTFLTTLAVNGLSRTAKTLEVLADEQRSYTYVT